MVESSEGTRAIALELCREFEDKFLQHITTGEVGVFTSSACSFSCKYICWAYCFGHAF